MVKREEYPTKIGKKLRNVLDKQKDNVRKATYGEVKASDYEAGEIIAQKMIDNKLV